MTHRIALNTSGRNRFRSALVALGLIRQRQATERSLRSLSDDMLDDLGFERRHLPCMLSKTGC